MVPRTGFAEGQSFRTPRELAPFVEHFWTVNWDLDEPQIAEVLPHPSVQLELEVGG